MRTVLIVDTETTGLDPAKDRCIEVAVVRYSIEHACVIASFASLIQGDANNANESINHIPARALPDANPSAWARALDLADGCEAVLAHNAVFDRGFVPADMLTGIPWICTKSGITWPHQSKPGASLVALALDHGLGVVDPHRALSDCMLLARLLTRCAELGNDLNALLQQGLRPQATFQALVSFDDKDKAKDAGFRWDAPSRRWLRKMATEDAQHLGFEVREVCGKTA